jgi:putative Mg2+ transporter-C (MgtC) family protein
MPLHPGWPDLALRLLLTLIAGGLIGFNRGESGHAAGLRTTILVCLAASVAMMQANILMPSAGRAHDSFVVLDLARWPLGILTGVGFIGAGAILRRGDMVQGVTTAATMWFVTVIGLCFGGGQLALGITGTLIGLFVLWVMKWLDDAIPRTQHARLIVVSDRDVPIEDLIRGEFPARRFGIRLAQTVYGVPGEPQEEQYDVRWAAAGKPVPPKTCLEKLRKEDGIRQVKWRGYP